MKEVNYGTLVSASPMVIEYLPKKPKDPKFKSEVFDVAREGNLPILNLKTGRTGKGEGCPNNCTYCDVGDKDGPYWRETDENNFKTIIINWVHQGGKIIHWCGDGEPTTFKWFDTILDLAQKHNFRIEMFSALNGLTPERADKLMDIGAIVKFKMDSRDPTILGHIMNKDIVSDDQALNAGTLTLKKIDMLIEAQRKSKNPNQLIASIVVSEKSKANLIGVLEWCCKFGVIPNMGYLEEIGSANQTGTKTLTEKETKKVNFWLRTKFGLEDPKQIMGDQCEGKAAPIIIGKKIFLGPFGMGCEFPLREHIGELNFIGEYREDIGELKSTIRDFRFSQENLTAIIGELQKIRDREGIYAKSGTDKILPGCGDDIEELWLLEYVATVFTSDEYFKDFINNWVLTGKHRKWTEAEVNDLINQVKHI